MTKFIAVTLGILLATLSVAGAGQAQAQQVATVQGTIQSVDCYSKALTIRTADGGQYRMYVTASNSVFVNSTPVSFCSLQQYVGSTVTVSVVPNGNQLAVTRVDVNTTATPSASDNQSKPLITGMPDWAKYALGAVLIGALIYIGTRHSAPKDPYYQYPYYKCPDGTIRTFCP